MSVLDFIFHPIHLVHCKYFGHMWSNWTPFGYPSYSRCLRCGKRIGDVA